MTKPHYRQNPDVVLREEGEDGGLLFNPDTNQVKVVNTTGLFIWQQFEQPYTAESIIQLFKENFEDVPEENIIQDVEDFVKELLMTGFLGELEN